MHFKTNHQQSSALGYLNINSVRNKFCSTPPLVEHNIEIYAIAKTKLGSSFPWKSVSSGGGEKFYRFDVISRKKDIPSKYC